MKSNYLARKYCRGLTGLPLRLISKCSRGLRSGPSTHGCDPLAFCNCLSFFYQQLGVVPVGTQVGVVMFKDNKLTVTDQSTARVDHPPGRRGNNGLSGFAVDQDARTTPRFPAKFDVDSPTCRPGPGGWRLRRDLG